jgi:hypothetical protein
MSRFISFDILPRHSFDVVSPFVVVGGILVKLGSAGGGTTHPRVPRSLGRRASLRGDPDPPQLTAPSPRASMTVVAVVVPRSLLGKDSLLVHIYYSLLSFMHLNLSLRIGRFPYLKIHSCLIDREISHIELDNAFFLFY